MLITKMDISITVTENDNREIVQDGKLFIWNRGHGWTLKSKSPIWASDLNLCLELTNVMNNYNRTSNNKKE